MPAVQSKIVTIKGVGTFDASRLPVLSFPAGDIAKESKYVHAKCRAMNLTTQGYVAFYACLRRDLATGQPKMPLKHVGQGEGSFGSLHWMANSCNIATASTVCPAVQNHYKKQVQNNLPTACAPPPQPVVIPPQPQPAVDDPEEEEEEEEEEEQRV